MTTNGQGSTGPNNLAAAPVDVTAILARNLNAQLPAELVVELQQTERAIVIIVGDPRTLVATTRRVLATSRPGDLDDVLPTTFRYDSLTGIAAQLAGSRLYVALSGPGLNDAPGLLEVASTPSAAGLMPWQARKAATGLAEIRAVIDYMHEHPPAGDHPERLAAEQPAPAAAGAAQQATSADRVPRWWLSGLARLTSFGGSIAYFFDHMNVFGAVHYRPRAKGPAFLIIVAFALLLIIVLVGQAQDWLGSMTTVPTDIASVARGVTPPGNAWVTLSGELGPGSLDDSGKNFPTDRIYVLSDPVTHLGLLVRSPRPLGTAGTVVTVSGDLVHPFPPFFSLDSWRRWAVTAVPGTDVTGAVYVAAFEHPPDGVASIVWAVLLGVLSVLAVLGWRAGYVAFRRTGGPADPSADEVTSPVFVYITGIVQDAEGTTFRVLSKPGDFKWVTTPSGAPSRLELAPTSLQTLSIVGDDVSEVEAGVVYPVSGPRPAIRFHLVGHVMVVSFLTFRARDTVLRALTSLRRGPDPRYAVRP